MLYGFAASSASLSVTAPTPGAPPPPVTTVTTVLLPTTTIAKLASRTGMFTVEVAGSIVFKTTGTGDADLYVRRGSAPTTAVADCKSEGSTSQETCALSASVGDKLYWLVYGYAAATAQLTATAPAASP